MNRHRRRNWWVRFREACSVFIEDVLDTIFDIQRAT